MGVVHTRNVGFTHMIPCAGSSINTIQDIYSTLHWHNISLSNNYYTQSSIYNRYNTVNAM